MTGVWYLMMFYIKEIDDVFFLLSMSGLFGRGTAIFMDVVCVPFTVCGL